MAIELDKFGGIEPRHLAGASRRNAGEKILSDLRKDLKSIPIAQLATMAFCVDLNAEVSANTSYLFCLKGTNTPTGYTRLCSGRFLVCLVNASPEQSAGAIVKHLPAYHDHRGVA